MKKDGAHLVILTLLFLFILCGLYVLNSGAITGLTILRNYDNSSFSNGSYQNTIWNGSAIVINTGVQGNYTSQIYDAGNAARWNNISLSFAEPTRESIFIVDASGAVYLSLTRAASWTQQTSNYGRGSNTQDLFENKPNLYISFTSGVKEIWRSQNNGLTWQVVNNSFTTNALRHGIADSSGNIYVITTNGEIYRSTDNGVTWALRGDANGAATNDPKGMTINSNDALFVVDGSGSIYKSTNGGINWTTQTSAYGGSSGTDDIAIDSNNNLYILFNSRVYKSVNEGVNWTVTANDYGSGQDGLVLAITPNDLLLIADPSGDIFSSTDGISWTLASDFNGASTSQPRGLTSYLSSSSLKYQYRNCSLADCSDGTFIGPSGTNSYFTDPTEELTATGRYFQYKVLLDSEISGLSPTIEEIAIDYSLLTSTPAVTIVSPLAGFTYSTNETLNLNFSIISQYLDSCWYSINGGANISLTACQNTTFNLPGGGTYNLTLYANESISGLQGSDSRLFTVALGAPLILITSPQNDSYLNTSNMTLSYNVSSPVGVDTCKLYGDFNGTYLLNQTKKNFTSVNNSFTLTLSQRAYLWSLACNSTQGASSSTSNYTFTLDFQTPNVTVYEPNGTYEINTVPLNYTANDTSPLESCGYVLFFNSGGSQVSVRVSTECNNKTSVTVNSPTNYQLSLESTDAAGNTGRDTTQFVVQTVVVEGASGGGASPLVGGGFSGLKKGAALGFADLPVLESKKGRKMLVEFSVLNRGTVFLHRCSIIPQGAFAEIIESSQVEDLSIVENKKFVFNLLIPTTLEEGLHAGEIQVACDEGSITIPLQIIVLPSDFSFEITGTERIRNVLRVNYVAENFLESPQVIQLDYILNNLDGFSLTEGNHTIALEGKERKEGILEFDLPKDAIGVFNLKTNLNSNEDSLTVEERVFLPSQGGGFTGFAVFGENQVATFSLFGVLLAAIILVFIAIKIRKIKRSRALVPKKSK